MLSVLGVLALLVFASIGATAVFMPGCERCHLEGRFGMATQASAHRAEPCESCHGGSTVESRISFAKSVVFGMVLPFPDVDPSVASIASSRCLSCHRKDIQGTVDRGGLRISHASCAGDRACTDCHSTTAHGEEIAWPTTANMESCFECHGSAAVPSGCDVCHSARLPRDRVRSLPFAVTHGPNAEQTHGMGDMSTCDACHTAARCVRCHGVGLPHSSDFVVKHGPVARSSAAQCADCHQVRFCRDCHGTVMPHPARFVKGHAKTVEANGSDACRKCHAADDCANCHVQHVHPVTAEQLELLQADPSREVPE